MGGSIFRRWATPAVWLGAFGLGLMIAGFAVPQTRDEFGGPTEPLQTALVLAGMVSWAAALTVVGGKVPLAHTGPSWVRWPVAGAMSALLAFVTMAALWLPSAAIGAWLWGP